MLGLAAQLGLVSPGARQIRSATEQSEIGDDEVGVAVESGWGILFLDSGPLLDIDLTRVLSAASTTRPIFIWLAQSASGGLWFEFHQHGSLERKWVEVESEVVETFGQPLAQEPTGFFSEAPDDDGIRDENTVLALAAAVTGISEDQLFSMPFAVFSGKHL